MGTTQESASHAIKEHSTMQSEMKSLFSSNMNVGSPTLIRSTTDTSTIKLSPRNNIICRELLEKEDDNKGMIRENEEAEKNVHGLKDLIAKPFGSVGYATELLREVGCPASEA
ncbi:hypothetical protein Nepgr_019924 [Nepenthes gracilis]|uniref:Uncharacterized protein n=1 Tax=Nepenthes gracilis TaxID=150966 RepID=A0AAD3SV06_NEPGR|nr:hypothetical protein Nepgr_019924 [Nepenthes gracilis]